MSFMFEKLDVYKKAVNFAYETSEIIKKFPRGNFYFTDQLNRAALSSSANIAEGNGRWHKADRKQFFYIARGSLHECVPILEICCKKKLITDKEYKELKNELVEISKMLAGLIKGLEK